MLRVAVIRSVRPRLDASGLLGQDLQRVEDVFADLPRCGDVEHVGAHLNFIEELLVVRRPQVEALDQGIPP